MRTLSTGVVLSLTLLGAACGGDEDGSSTSGDDVAGVVWQLTELAGEPLPDGVTVTLEYDGARVGGSAGCNTYGGEAAFENGTVTISSELMTTLMACAPPAEEVERTFLAALPTATGFAVDGDAMTLSSDGESLLVFVGSSTS